MYLAIDLQHGHLVERIGGRGDGFECQRGLTQEVTGLQRPHRDDAARIVGRRAAGLCR